MKKFLALVLAMMLVLSMSAVAFADGETTEPTATQAPTYTDVSTITVTKNYNVTNTGNTIISPEETFRFTTLTCTSVTNAADGVTTSNAPVPTIGTVTYNAGEAGSATKTKTININIPDTYTSVGVYTYTFSEIDNATAGVTYFGDTITLVVTVLQDENGKIRVAAVHTETNPTSGSYGVEPKTDVFNNVYSAGSLTVNKQVTGIYGDQSKEFTVKVTFTAPSGDYVREEITYTDGTENKEIAVGKTTVGTGDEAEEIIGWTGSQEVEITLKHGESVTFNNIPYGVTYTVVENDYTAEDDGGYDAASYAFDDSNKKIDSASEKVIITNNKDGAVDTGISLDNMPYVIIMGLVVLAGAAMLMKKRSYND